MIVDFQLLNEDGLVIGKARLNLPTEDVEAAKLGLQATGEAYTQCRWLKYNIYTTYPHLQECHGLMYIRSCQDN